MLESGTGDRRDRYPDDLMNPGVNWLPERRRPLLIGLRSLVAYPQRRKPRDTGNVVNLMDALRKSLSDAGEGGASQPAKGKKPKRAASGQREMLMAISGKGEGNAKPAAKETKRPTRQRKAGASLV
jgi:hypothetical protein